MQILGIGAAVGTLLSESFWPLALFGAVAVACVVIVYKAISADSDRREPWQ